MLSSTGSQDPTTSSRVFAQIELGHVSVAADSRAGVFHHFGMELLGAYDSFAAASHLHHGHLLRLDSGPPTARKRRFGPGDGHVSSVSPRSAPQRGANLCPGGKFWSEAL